MNNVKKVPMRKCVGCNVSKPKKELYRIVKIQDNSIKFDSTGKINGRGIYICSINCLNRVIKSKRLEKEFDIKISEEEYSQLINDLNKCISGGEIIG